MTDTEVRAIYESYLNAFAAASVDEQERLLRESVAADLVFSNPGVEGSGLRTLLAHIGAFQRKFPGHHFRMNWIRQQHGHFLAEWTQLTLDNSELVTGHSYGRLDEDGHIACLAGFWSAGAV